jgi:hypothetical protein
MEQRSAEVSKILIDERVKHVGLTMLRKLNACGLRKLGDNLFVLQDADEPLAVLVSYEMFMRMQAEREGARA